MDTRREQIIDIVTREFIGPDPIDKPGMIQENGEEILSSDPPRIRYAAGILFPQKVSSDSNTADENSEVIENDTEKGVITYRVAPYANYRIVDGRFVTYGSNWDMVPCAGIAFEGDSKRLVYRTSDIGVGVTDVVEIAPRVIRAPWNDNRLVPGTVIAMRSYYRPTPGIFVSNSNNTCFSNVTVHYAEGMGLLMQTCENVTLDNFNVSLREGDGRYFTTQADATHFSSCKGVITSKNGLYEGMMDDAINVHGTYLRVVERLDDYTLVGRYITDLNGEIKIENFIVNKNPNKGKR